MCLKAMTHPLKPVADKQVLNLTDCVKTPCKNSPLDCHQPSHHHNVVQKHGILIDLIQTMETPVVGHIKSRRRDFMFGARKDC